jgi:uncharacterized protein
MNTHNDSKLPISRLPQQLPIKNLGTQYKKIAGYVKMQSLARVNELLVSSAENKDLEFWVDLNFSKIRRGNILVEGHIDHTIKLTCQRCVQAIEHKIDADLRVVLTEKIDKTDNSLCDYEIIVVQNNEMLDLYQVIEDEMILSLPIVVKHDETNTECLKHSSFII